MLLQVTNQTRALVSQEINYTPGWLVHLSQISQLVIVKVTSTGEPEMVTQSAAPDLDEFTQRLSADDARVLVDLLKLAVANRAGDRGNQALSHVLTALGKSYPQVKSRRFEPAFVILVLCAPKACYVQTVPSMSRFLEKVHPNANVRVTCAGVGDDPRTVCHGAGGRGGRHRVRPQLGGARRRGERAPVHGRHVAERSRAHPGRRGAARRVRPPVFDGAAPRPAHHHGRRRQNRLHQIRFTRVLYACGVIQRQRSHIIHKSRTRDEITRCSLSQKVQFLTTAVAGREWSDWSQELRISGDELRWKFTSDGSVNGWGWRFTVYPILPAAAPLDMLSDRTVLSRPSIDLVTCLLDFNLQMSSDRNIVPRLAAALAACAQLSSLGEAASWSV